MQEEGAEEGNRVLMAVDVTEIVLQEMTSVGQLNLVPKYRKHIWLGSLGTNPKLQWVACSYQVAGLVETWPYQNG